MKYYDFINMCRDKDYSNLSTHVHHIQPRSQGGSDKPDNLITLSVHDHFWAHVWYAEEFNECKTAPNFLLHNYKTEVHFTDREWDEAYRIAIRLMGDSKIGNKNMLGKRHSEESKEQNRIKHLGNKHTEDVIKIISSASKNMWSKRKSNPDYVSWTLGRKWYNNGVKSIMDFECPRGFVPGRLNGSLITKNGWNKRKKKNENNDDSTSFEDFLS